MRRLQVKARWWIVSALATVVLTVTGCQTLTRFPTVPDRGRQPIHEASDLDDTAYSRYNATWWPVLLHRFGI